eukprot:m.171301 g.171301  ORF g.171301 m.171301 type:complete len:133 (+) comp53264_c1_seq5:1004-1402(+)
MKSSRLLKIVAVCWLSEISNLQCVGPCSQWLRRSLLRSLLASCGSTSSQVFAPPFPLLDAFRFLDFSFCGHGRTEATDQEECQPALDQVASDGECSARGAESTPREQRSPQPAVPMPVMNLQLSPLDMELPE